MKIGFCNGSRDAVHGLTGIACMFEISEYNTIVCSKSIEDTCDFEQEALNLLFSEIIKEGQNPRDFTFNLQNRAVISQLSLEGYSVSHIDMDNPLHRKVHKLAAKARVTGKEYRGKGEVEDILQNCLESLRFSYYAGSTQNKYVIKIGRLPWIVTESYALFTLFLKELNPSKFYCECGCRYEKGYLAFKRNIDKDIQKDALDSIEGDNYETFYHLLEFKEYLKQNLHI